MRHQHRVSIECTYTILKHRHIAAISQPAAAPATLARYGRPDGQIRYKSIERPPRLRRGTPCGGNRTVNCRGRGNHKRAIFQAGDSAIG